MTDQGYLLANRLRVRSELPLPERLADHRAWRSATWPDVVSGNEPAGERLDPQRTEEVAAYPKTLGIAGLAAPGKVESLVAPREDARKSLLAISDLVPLRIGKVGAAVGET